MSIVYIYMLVIHDLNTLMRKHGPNIEYFHTLYGFLTFSTGVWGNAGSQFESPECQQKFSLS